MSGNYDPKTPRMNIEFREIWRTILHQCREMKDADSYGQIRGYCLVLQSHIEELLNTPEYVVDLAKGPSASAASLLLPRDEKKAGLKLESPFDQPGFSSGQCFYYSYSGQVTALFSDGDDLYEPFDLSGYWVLRFEKVYTGQEGTAFHITSEEALHRMHAFRKQSLRDAIGHYAVLMDPQGVYDGRSARMVSLDNQLKQAVGRVDEWGRKYGIRYLVARLIGFIDTH